MSTTTPPNPGPDLESGDNINPGVEIVDTNLIRPYQLAIVKATSKVKEVISRPWEDGGRTVVNARDPGDPISIARYAVDDLHVVVKVRCNRDGHEWVAAVQGEYRNCHIDCPKCGRGYFAERDDDGGLLQFLSDRPLEIVVPA